VVEEDQGAGRVKKMYMQHKFVPHRAARHRSWAGQKQAGGRGGHAGFVEETADGSEAVDDDDDDEVENELRRSASLPCLSSALKLSYPPTCCWLIQIEGTVRCRVRQTAAARSAGPLGSVSNSMIFVLTPLSSSSAFARWQYPQLAHAVDALGLRNRAPGRARAPGLG